MSDVSNNDLLNVLLEIKNDVGQLKQQATGHTAWMTQHVEDDKKMAKDINTLQMQGARQKGFLGALSIMGGGLTYAIGFLFEKWMSGSGHQ